MEGEVLFRPIGCPWHPDLRVAGFEGRVETDVGRGWLGLLPLSRGR